MICKGGINKLQTQPRYDEGAYSPPKAVERVRKLVEGDEVLLFTFQIIGTPDAAVQKCRGGQLLATGASRFSDPQRAWLIAFNPNYQSGGGSADHSEKSPRCQNRHLLG